MTLDASPAVACPVPDAPSGHSIDDFTHMMNLDGHHDISAYYDAVDSQIRYDGTKFGGCTWHPAGSYEAERGKGAEFNGNTFSGMRDGDAPVTLNGRHSDTRIEDTQGGHFVIDGQISGLHIEGVSTAISMHQNSSISGMTVDEGTHILALNMQPGATIAHSDLADSLVSPSSQLQGGTFQNVTMEGSLRDADLTNFQATSVRFNGTDMTGATWQGARLTNVAFDGIDPNKLNLAGVESMQGVSVNGQPIDSPKQLIALQQAESVRVAMQSQLANFGSPDVTYTPPAQAPPMEIADSRSASTGFRFSQILAQISGGDHVNDHGEIIPGRAALEQAKATPAEQQAQLGRPLATAAQA